MTTTRWLKTTQTYSLTVLEASSLKSRDWQAWLPSEALRENLFCASLPAPVGSLAALDVPQLVTASLSLSPHGPRPCVFPCLWLDPSYKDTSPWVWGHLRSRMTSSSLTTCGKTFQTESHSEVPGECEMWGDDVQPSRASQTCRVFLPPMPSDT